MGEEDPLLARLLAAATAGASPAGPAHKRAPVRIVHDPLVSRKASLEFLHEFAAIHSLNERA
jgi:hypothetical protein